MTGASTGAGAGGREREGEKSEVGEEEEGETAAGEEHGRERRTDRGGRTASEKRGDGALLEMPAGTGRRRRENAEETERNERGNKAEDGEQPAVRIGSRKVKGGKARGS